MLNCFQKLIFNQQSAPPKSAARDPRPPRCYATARIWVACFRVFCKKTETTAKSFLSRIEFSRLTKNCDSKSSQSLQSRYHWWVYGLGSTTPLVFRFCCSFFIIAVSYIVLRCFEILKQWHVLNPTFEERIHVLERLNWIWAKLFNIFYIKCLKIVFIYCFSMFLTAWFSFLNSSSFTVFFGR